MKTKSSGKLLATLAIIIFGAVLAGTYGNIFSVMQGDSNERKPKTTFPETTLNHETQHEKYIRHQNREEILNIQDGKLKEKQRYEDLALCGSVLNQNCGPSAEFVNDCVANEIRKLPYQCQLFFNRLNSIIKNKKLACAGEIFNMCPDIDDGTHRLPECIRESKLRFSKNCQTLLFSANQH